MKNILSIILSIMVLMLVSCGEDTPEIREPSTVTLRAQDVAHFTALLRGEVRPNDREIADAGFYFGTSPDPTATNSTIIQTEEKTFLLEYIVDKLELNTTYYYRVWAETSEGNLLTGEVESFTTWEGGEWMRGEEIGNSFTLPKFPVSFNYGDKTYFPYDETTIYTFSHKSYSWDEIKISNGASSYSILFFHDNIAYIGNGGKFISFNPQNDQVTQLSDYPDPLADDGVAYFQIGTNGYAGLGRINPSFYRYDIIENEWSEIAEYPGDGRFRTLSYSDGSEGFCGGGEYSASMYLKVYKYDPQTNIWEYAFLLPKPLSLASSFYHKETTYIINGFSKIDGPSIENENVYIKSKTSDEWEDILKIERPKGNTRGLCFFINDQQLVVYTSALFIYTFK